MAVAWDRIGQRSRRSINHQEWPLARPSQSSRSRGKLIAVGNLKGGTGKSTLAVNLAGMMASNGQNVCVVDCDPQGTSSSWLARGQIQVATEVMPVNAVGKVVDWLAKASAMTDRYDIVIIDLPSVLTPALASAYLLAHVILIPVSTSSIDLHGTKRVMRHIRVVRDERADAPPKVMLVPTRVPEDQLAQKTLDSVFAEFKERVGPPLRERDTFKQAFTERRWVGQLAAQEAAHADVSVLHAAVMELLDEAPTPPLLTERLDVKLTHAVTNSPQVTNPPANDIQPKPSFLRRIISFLS